jgi:hypothetical protein
MKNLGEKTPTLEPVMYLVPIIATIGFVIVMISGKPRTGGRKASGKNLPQRELAT